MINLFITGNDEEDEYAFRRMKLKQNRNHKRRAKNNADISPMDLPDSNISGNPSIRNIVV